MSDASTGLRDLAEILRSVTPNPRTIERRAVEVNRALVERRSQLDPSDPLIDFIKAAQWLLCCLTVDGRVEASKYALTKATELGAKLTEGAPGFEVTPQWLMAEADRLAPLPTFDKETRERTAQEFESLADRLEKAWPRIEGFGVEVDEFEPDCESSIEEPTLLAAEIQKRLEVSDNTLRRYAKAAGVPVGKQGGRGHRYSATQLQTILAYVVASVQVADTVVRAKKWRDETVTKPS
jgi:hypothetical protein